MATKAIRPSANLLSSATVSLQASPVIDLAQLSWQEQVEHALDSAAAWSSVAEAGLPTAGLALLKEQGLTPIETSNVIPARTLKHRKRRGEKLSTEETERFLRVVRVLKLASKVFGERAKALDWLRDPDLRLKGRAPIEVLKTEGGGRQVESMLWQIDEGMFA